MKTPIAPQSFPSSPDDQGTHVSRANKTELSAPPHSSTFEPEIREHHLRLSPHSIRQLLIGLNWLVNHHELWLMGHAPHSRPDVRWRWDVQQKAKYDQRFKDMIVVLRDRLADIKQKGGRVYCRSPFDIAAMMLAVRASRQLHLHGLIRNDRKSSYKAPHNLLKRLENRRKSAKRTMIRVHGIEAYRRESRSWQSFVRWVRLRFLHFNGAMNRRPGYRKDWLNSFVDWTRVELTARREEIPEAKELRRLVRLALRYVRRGRRNYGVLTLRADSNFAAGELASFVIKQVKKANQTKRRADETHNKQ